MVSLLVDMKNYYEYEAKVEVKTIQWNLDIRILDIRIPYKKPLYSYVILRSRNGIW